MTTKRTKVLTREEAFTEFAGLSYNTLIKAFPSMTERRRCKLAKQFAKRKLKGITADHIVIEVQDETPLLERIKNRLTKLFT